MGQDRWGDVIQHGNRIGIIGQSVLRTQADGKSTCEGQNCQGLI